MPIRDDAAANASLDNDYGSTKGPNAPAAHELTLFNGDPSAGGSEVTDAPRVTVANDGTNWPTAASNRQKVGIAHTFGGTATYALEGTHWALIDAADGTTMWDTGELAEIVTEPTDTVTPVVFIPAADEE